MELGCFMLVLWLSKLSLNWCASWSWSGWEPKDGLITILTFVINKWTYSLMTRYINTKGILTANKILFSYRYMITYYLIRLIHFSLYILICNISKKICVWLKHHNERYLVTTDCSYLLWRLTDRLIPFPKGQINRQIAW